MERSARGESVDVLLVESDQDDVDRIMDAFTRAYAKATIHVVRDKEDATEFIHQRGEHAEAPLPDLILLDLHLSDDGGEDLLATLKGDLELHRTPVLVMVAGDNEDTVKRVYDLDANAYIQKPDNPVRFNTVADAITRFWLTTARLPPEL